MIIEWIVSSCFVILVAAALRSLFGRRISANTRYTLWILVLVRLLVPVQLFSSPVAGLYVSPLPEVLQQENIYLLPVQSIPLEDAVNISIEEDGAILDANSFGYARLEDGGTTVRRYAARLSPLEILGWLWLTGSLLMGLALLSFNFYFAARIRRIRRPLKGNLGPIPVFVAGGLPSPCLFGLFRTAIYVTPETAENPDMLRHVITHEATHYRHLDHLWSVLRGIALAVHWWNPLVWLAVILSRRDGEMACDESALKRLGDGERKAYGETLLSLVTAKGGPRDLLSFATTMTGGKKSLRERIHRIACKQKCLVSATVAIILLLCLTVVCAFGRKEELASPQVVGTRDLDLDGELEEIWVLEKSVEPPEWSLSVVKGNQKSKDATALWSVTLDATHGRCGTYFSYRDGSRDYLLEYTPKMQQGVCTYAYRLFHLKNGEEVTDRENAVTFDINFSSTSHQFDPAAIASFMEEVNALISKSILLLNTNRWMVNLKTDEAGRLYDDILAVLSHPGEDLHGRPLQEALEIYAQQAADHPDDTWSPLADLLMNLEPDQFRGITGCHLSASGLMPLLRGASRGSRFYTWSSYWDARNSHVTEEDEALEWCAEFLDGNRLHLITNPQSDSKRVLMILEMPDEAVAAFYDAPELWELMCAGEGETGG